jgi:hypothetical protein
MKRKHTIKETKGRVSFGGRWNLIRGPDKQVFAKDKWYIEVIPEQDHEPFEGYVIQSTQTLGINDTYTPLTRLPLPKGWTGRIDLTLWSGTESQLFKFELFPLSKRRQTGPEILIDVIHELNRQREWHIENRLRLLSDLLKSHQSKVDIICQAAEAMHTIALSTTSQS